MDSLRREKIIHGTEAFPFEIYNAAQQGGDIVPCHWHPEHEIILVTKGPVGVTLGDAHFDAETGDLFFVSSGGLHEIQSGMDSSFLAAVFPLDFLQFSRADYAQSEILSPLYEQKTILPQHLSASHQVSPEIRELFLSACDSYRRKIPGYQLLVKAQLLHIISLCSCFGLLKRNSGQTSDYRLQMLRSIISYLEEHFHEHLSQPEIAAKFGLSPQYFCTFFRENFGRTPVQHINFLRTEYASRLLRETDLPIMEIGFRSGFDNFSYFIRRFREVFGCTPSEYRKQLFPAQTSSAF